MPSASTTDASSTIPKRCEMTAVEEEKRNKQIVTANGSFAVGCDRFLFLCVPLKIDLQDKAFILRFEFIV